MLNGNGKSGYSCPAHDLGGKAFSFFTIEYGGEMATHSSILAWRIPGMGQPGGLPSMGSHRVRHD